MFQFILFVIILFIVYFVSRNYPPSNVEGFDTPGEPNPLSAQLFPKELNGTPLEDSNTLIFTPGFQGSDRRRMPVADSFAKFGSLWSPSQELFRKEVRVDPGGMGAIQPSVGMRLSPFKPGKRRSITFDENTSQIAGPIHKPPCPLTGTGPSDAYVGQSNDSNQPPGRRHLVLHDLDKVWTGHERDERQDLISAAMQSMCECDDPG